MASILIVMALLLLAVGIVWMAVRWHFIWQARQGSGTGHTLAATADLTPPPPVADDPFAHAPPVATEEAHP